jgi:DNA-directed RNA polymerase subunit RPC12/RpoP
MNTQVDTQFGTSKKARFKSSRFRFGLAEARYPSDADFRCIYCRQHVSSVTILSGVNNRNHCPYCLWSRHLDLHKAGDRLAACKEKMRPIGLTFKRTPKKYAQETCGELMLIHLCIECGQVSINRIAADDDVETVLRVFQGSLELDSQTRSRLEKGGIRVLETQDAATVHVQLLGRDFADVSSVKTYLLNIPG